MIVIMPLMILLIVCTFHPFWAGIKYYTPAVPLLLLWFFLAENLPRKTWAEECMERERVLSLGRRFRRVDCTSACLSLTKASSAIPYKRTPPSWLKMKPEDSGWEICGSLMIFREMEDEVSTFNVSWKGSPHLEHFKLCACVFTSYILSAGEDVTDHICKLAKKGCGMRGLRDPSFKGWSDGVARLTPSQIGVTLRPAGGSGFRKWEKKSRMLLESQGA